MRSRSSSSYCLASALIATLALGATGCRSSSAEPQQHENNKPEAAAPIAVKQVTAQEPAVQVESLKAQQAQAALDCQRTDTMFQKGAISKAEYDRGRTQCETSKFAVSAAEARKSLTAEALRDTEIKAPFSGMVVERFVTNGEYVRADSPVVTLVDTDNLRVELTVPEADVAEVKQGMT